MPIEQFTREEFEAALPNGKWSAIGINQGEYCYEIPVSHREYGLLTSLLIRSSVHADGVAADVGQDSIRIMIVDGVDRKVIASKSVSHVKRTKNWRTTMMTHLREAYKLALHIRPCPRCKHIMGLYRVKSKDSRAYGLHFLKCLNERCGRTIFEKRDDANA